MSLAKYLKVLRIWKFWAPPLAVFLVLYFFFYYAPIHNIVHPYQLLDPFKVTDPADPRFDPFAFRFEDYRTQQERTDAVMTLCQPGRTRAFIEKVFVQPGRTRILGHENNERRFTYFYRSWVHEHWWNATGYPFGIDVMVEYDADDIVLHCYYRDA